MIVTANTEKAQATHAVDVDQSRKVVAVANRVHAIPATWPAPRATTLRPDRRKCGCSSMAEQKLPKLTTRVRFPSPAPPLRQTSRFVGKASGFPRVFSLSRPLKSSDLPPHPTSVGAKSSMKRAWLLSLAPNLGAMTDIERSNMPLAGVAICHAKPRGNMAPTRYGEPRRQSSTGQPPIRVPSRSFSATARSRIGCAFAGSTSKTHLLSPRTRKFGQPAPRVNDREPISRCSAREWRLSKVRLPKPDIQDATPYLRRIPLHPCYEACRFDRLRLDRDLTSGDRPGA